MPVRFCFILIKVLFLCSIIQSCLVVFFKQLSSWLLYGQLIDQYGEFFIQHVSDAQGTSTSTTVDSFSSQDTNEILSLVCWGVSFNIHITYCVNSHNCFTCKVFCSYCWVMFHLLSWNPLVFSCHCRSALILGMALCHRIWCPSITEFWSWHNTVWEILA
jgi:hypothetical protein